MFLGKVSRHREMFADCVFLNPYSAAFTEKKPFRLQILDSSTSEPLSVKPGLKMFLRSLYHNMYTEPMRYKSKRYSSIKTECSTLGLIKFASTSSLECS